MTVLKEWEGDSCLRIRNIALFLDKEWISPKQLDVFSVEINKKTIEKDDEYELITRLKKGASLTQTNLLNYSPIIDKAQSWVIKYEPGLYLLRLREAEERYNCFAEECTLDLLASEDDLRKIGQGYETVPDDASRAQLSYTCNYETFPPPKRIARLEYRGLDNHLMDKVCEFVDQENGKTSRKINKMAFK